MSTPPHPRSPEPPRLADELLAEGGGLEAGAETPPASEDGSAPEPVHVERLRLVRGHRNVRCARCLEFLEAVFPDQVEDGVWESLQAAGALTLEVSGGYGMYVDPMGWDRDGSDAVLLTCERCTSWLRSELPGLDLVLSRLERR